MVESSLLSLIFHADLLVQIVMLVLVFASIWSLAIVIDGHLALKKTFLEIKSFNEALKEKKDLFSIHEKVDNTNQLAFSIHKISTELKNFFSGNKPTEKSKQMLQRRVNGILSNTYANSMDKLDRGIGHLATISSACPFIGLFGTVWGILHSFQSIAVSKNTSLAIVAPGIAEALFATALGLIAAIPALIFYNSFNNRMTRIESYMERFADDVNQRVALEIENEE